MLGQNDPTYKDIIKSISAIIFLSTPHRGTNLAEVLNRILQVSFFASPMQFISELATGSQTLQKLNEQFRHVAPKLDIVSFYETRPTSMMNSVRKTKLVRRDLDPCGWIEKDSRLTSQIQMVLEKESSMLGYPGEISKPLDADHHRVCKYESREDPSYITVRNALMALTSRVETKGSCCRFQSFILNDPTY
ncbi:hypothetical protein IMZ48_46600 [Candidatus Bathyarchaeota archaeon]|nr:hypothetical protein [Candidatus Bathyarchaeota archaeon]